MNAYNVATGDILWQWLLYKFNYTQILNITQYSLYMHRNNWFTYMQKSAHLAIITTDTLVLLLLLLYIHTRN